MTPFRREFITLSALAWPVVLTRVATLMLGIVDTWMVARLGTGSMEAVGLADVIQFGSIIVVIGVLQGMDPVVSQAHGTGDQRRMALALQRGLLLSIVLTIPLSILWIYTGDLLSLLGQSNANCALADTYAHAQIFSIAPLLVLVVLQQYLAGRGIMKPALVIVLAANLLNVLFNEALIFGRFGAPELGVQGAAIATGLTRVASVIALGALIFGKKLWAGAWIPWNRDSFALRGFVEIVRIGTPIGIAIALEVWAFNASTLFAGWLPTPNAAAHIIVLKVAALAFMMPLGLGVAVATRVGNLIGKGDCKEAQLAAWVALGMGVALMLFSSTLFVLGRYAIPRAFTDNAEAITLAAGVLPVAAAFQLFDSTQAIGSGILRGMGRTLPAALISLLAYCVLAMPLGFHLAFRRSWGLSGIWWGLAAGLGVASVLLVAWIRVRGPATCAPSSAPSSGQRSDPSSDPPPPNSPRDA